MAHSVQQLFYRAKDNVALSKVSDSRVSSGVVEDLIKVGAAGVNNTDINTKHAASTC